MSSISNNKLQNLAAIASIATATLLCVLKAGAAIASGSLAILSSMIDSLSDIAASLITFIAVRFSQKPLSYTHRYGYGRAESISALFQAAFIIGSALFIIYDAADRFFHNKLIADTTIGIAVMLICLLCTVMLLLLQRYVIKKTQSLAIKADSQHYLVDLLSNTAVIISLLVVQYWHWKWFDILTAIIIALYLIFNAYDLAKQALNELTDAELAEPIKQQILQTALTEKGVMGVHDLRTRCAGSQMFIEMHVEFDGKQTLYQTHDLSEKIENKIMQDFPTAQVIIHQDPYGIKEKRIDHEITGSCRI